MRERQPTRNWLASSVAVVVVVAALALSITAVTDVARGADGPRETVGAAEPPVVVYQGEQLNVTQVKQTGSGTPIGTGSVGFEGVAGDADGQFEQASSAASVDFTTFATGSYDTNEDGEYDFVVREPEVRAVTIRTASGGNVTGGRIDPETAVTIGAAFNFESADRAEVTVTDPDGLDVTREVIGTGTASHLTTSSDTVSADFAAQPEGVYQIAVGASDLDVERTVLLVVRDGTAATLNRSRVRQGEPVTVAIRGAPGAQRHLRIDNAHLDDVPTTAVGARQVFRETETVTDRVGSAGAVAAVVTLDERGEASVQIETDRLRADSVTRIAFVRGDNLRTEPIGQLSLRVEGATDTATPEPTSTTEPVDSPTATATSTATTTAATEPATAGTQTTADGPGFGVWSVLAAFVGLALLTRRE